MTYEERAARTLADAEDTHGAAGILRHGIPLEQRALTYAAAAVEALVGIGWALLAAVEAARDVSATMRTWDSQ